MGQTVNLLAFAFGGSNPSAPTTTKRFRALLGRKRAAQAVRAAGGPPPGGRKSDECGSSSVDRASAFQAEGREFEPRLPL